MSTIISVGINRDKIKFNEKGWANVTIYVNDETNQYGQNVSAAMEQTKEQRENKDVKEYVGNGKVVWTSDGKIAAADRVEGGTLAKEQSTAGRETPDLPF